MHHHAEVLGDHLAHPVRDGRGDVDAVDAAVLDALSARSAGDRDAASLEVQHRLALGGAHQHLGAGAGGEARLQPARGVAGREERLRPRGVVAVHEDLLGAVDGDRLRVGGEPAHAELELGRLLDGALGERPGARDLAADEQGERVGGGVPQDGDGRLELPEAVRDGRGGIGGDQQRMVDPVRDVRLDGGRAAHSHLLHRLEDLDRRQEREHLRDLGGRHARDEPRDLPARDGRVDQHAREGERVERHGLLGHGDVDATAGDELVEQVEVRLRLAVELDDPPALDAERRLRVEWARERDEAERRILGNEVVAADRPCRVELGP